MTDLPRHLHYKMTLTLRFASAWERRYWVEGRDGAVEFWVRETPGLTLSDPLWYGGFEVHSVTPSEDRPPSHAECPQCSGRPCWHDDTSSWATDDWIPWWKEDPDNHERVFRRLASEYDHRFKGAAEATDAS